LRWTRDLLCVMQVGRCGYVGFLLLYELIIVRSMISYYVCCRNYMYNIYIYIYTMCNTIQEYGFCSYRFINLFKLLLYFTVILNQVKNSIIYLFISTK